MITVVPPDKQYVPEIGHVLWSGWIEAASALNVLDGDEINTPHIIPLIVVWQNPITALQCFQIDRDWFLKVLHEDPYTRQTVYGIVPIAILTDDPEKYRDGEPRPPLGWDHVLDTEFHQQMMHKRIFELYRVPDILLGSGYCEGCSHFDGMYKLKNAKLKLSNDDWLYVAFWEWYNK